VIRVGCCGFPRAQTLCYEKLDVVEIQQVFYRPPRLSTVERWRRQAPPDFTFTLKAWQLITHEPSSPTYRRLRMELPAPPDRYGSFRPTAEVYEAWERSRELALALQAPILLFQCPASFTPTEEHKVNLRSFFRKIDRRGLALAWEPRGEWADEEIAELCQELNLIHAVDPFQRLPVTNEVAYFRLHGRGGYRYQYTDQELAQLAEWCAPYPTVYCLFNNTSMFEDALRFRELVRHRGYQTRCLP